jgi:hypothetical protein
MSKIIISYPITLEIKMVMNCWYINIASSIIIVNIIIVVRPISMMKAYMIRAIL